MLVALRRHTAKPINCTPRGLSSQEIVLSHLPGNEQMLSIHGLRSVRFCLVELGPWKFGGIEPSTRTKKSPQALSREFYTKLQNPQSLYFRPCSALM